MKVSENVPISSLTTMRLGGPARFLVDVETKADVASAYAFARSQNLPVFVIGGGANTLGHDEGFNGVLIRNAMKGITEEDGIITAMGGTVWDDVVEYACKKEYTGIEALSKIPGLAGAAPVQNIGAYGQDISQVFHSADVYDSEIQNFIKRRFSFFLSQKHHEHDRKKSLFRYFNQASIKRRSHGTSIL